jgi:putative transposase
MKHSGHCPLRGKISVVSYIENQEPHHRKKTFIEEYTKIFQDFEIDFDEKYIFKPIVD